MPRLNWGCAFDIREGWVNSDRDDHGQEHVGDLLDGLPFEDDYFDCIVANHSLQMIRFDDLPRALAELRRVLKPGGTLRILVPDFERALRAYNQLDKDYFPIDDSIAFTTSGKLLRYMFWHGDARSAFTWASLHEILFHSNFGSVQKVHFGETLRGIADITELDSREGESLIVEATK